jgi:short-subunit dehydrogenase
MGRILIAGGTDGIGLSFARLWAKSRRDEVFIVGRDFSRIDGSFSELSNGRLNRLQVDVRDLDAVESAFSNIEEIDIFVNTIGTFLKKPVSQNVRVDVEKHFQINCVANIHLTNLAVSKLSKNFSQILVCLSTLVNDPKENYSLQSATKSAYFAYLQVLRKERPDIRVTTISPTSIDTGIFKKGNDDRYTGDYPHPDCVAEIMSCLLSLPDEIELRDISVWGRCR